MLYSSKHVVNTDNTETRNLKLRMDRQETYCTRVIIVTEVSDTSDSIDNNDVIYLATMLWFQL